MKIPLHLEQFKEERALLLVTGKQDAVIYKASEGFLEKVDSFKIPRPHYSDNEGRFGQSRGGGKKSKGAVQGGVREIQDKDIIRDFLHELNIHLKKVGTAGISAVYLFTPSQIKNMISEALPVELKANIKAIIEGNYFTFSPIALLGKLEGQGI